MRYINLATCSHRKFLLYRPVFSDKIMSMVIVILIASIPVIFEYSEAHGQTMASTDIAGTNAERSANNGDSGSNTTHSDIVDCIINICITPNFQLPSNTSIIAIAFVNLTLKDIQDYKDVLKLEMSQHIIDTIDNLATGQGRNFSICTAPEYRFELPCPLIKGIIIPPQNVTQ